MKYEMAVKIARELVDELRPGCLEVEFAGGLRRLKTDPHDIEIVARPALVPVTDLLGEQVDDYSLLDEELGRMVDAERLIPAGKAGPRFKQFRVPPSGVVLDLFVVVPPAQWGYIMAIRTGPAHYSQWLVTARSKNGARPSHLEARNGALWQGERLIETPTERSFFEALGVEMPAPQDRMPLWGRFNASEGEEQ